MTAVLTTGRHRRLHPGDVVLAERGDTLETLLGSCIAVMLSDPRRTVGAMCHIVHGAPALSAARDSTAHAGTALAAMYALLQRHGVAPGQCQAHVVGGGNMFPGLYPQRHVGADNARAVLQALARDGVQLLVQDVGGSSYRRVCWTIGAAAPVVGAVPV